MRAIGNFLHHNYDYGVVARYGASVLIQGNTTAYRHAHSFVSDAAADTSYQAFDNFVLRKTVSAHTGHDFDVHGGLNECGHLVRRRGRRLLRHRLQHDPRNR